MAEPAGNKRTTSRRPWEPAPGDPNADAPSRSYQLAVQKMQRDDPGQIRVVRRWILGVMVAFIILLLVIALTS